MWTWEFLGLGLGLGLPAPRRGRLSSICIVLCGDRVPEESEDPRGTPVRRATR